MAVLMVLVGGGLRLAIVSAEKVDKQAQRDEDLRIVQHIVRRQLRQAVASYEQDPELGNRMLFFGDLDYVEFVSPMLSHLGLGGLYRQQIRFTDHQDGKKLELLWRQHETADPDQDDEPQWDSAVLMEDLREAQISYYGAEDQNEQAQWLAQWEENSQVMPLAVQIEFVSANGRLWPPIVARLGGRVVKQAGRRPSSGVLNQLGGFAPDGGDGR